MSGKFQFGAQKRHFVKDELAGDEAWSKGPAEEAWGKATLQVIGAKLFASAMDFAMPTSFEW